MEGRRVGEEKGGVKWAPMLDNLGIMPVLRAGRCPQVPSAVARTVLCNNVLCNVLVRILVKIRKYYTWSPFLGQN